MVESEISALVDLLRAYRKARFAQVEDKEQIRLFKFKIREFGLEANARGGLDAMLDIYEKVEAVEPDLAYRLEYRWDGIGNWRA